MPLFRILNSIGSSKIEIMLQNGKKNKIENHSLLVCSSVVAVAVVAVHYTLWIYAQCGNNAK